MTDLLKRGFVVAFLWAASDLLGAQNVAREITVPTSQAPLQLLGRYDDTDRNAVRFGYPGSGFDVHFNGRSLTFSILSDSDTNCLTVMIDHGAPQLVLLQKGSNKVASAAGLTPGDHALTVIKRSETWQGLVTLTGFLLTDARLTPERSRFSSRKLLFVGDSVTCGAGVDNNAQCSKDPARPNGDPYRSYGLILGRRLDAQVQLVCYGGRGLQRDYRGLTAAEGILNAPEFLDLAIATDERSTRAAWIPERWMPDGIFVSLGTNDFNLESTQPLDGARFVADYVALLRRLRREYPAARIFATEGAIVTNPLLRQYIQQAVAIIHDPGIVWVQSEHHPGNGCDAHPTAAQHEQMAADFEPLLRNALHW